MRWPLKARHLYEEKYPSIESGKEWNRLTPFKVSMAHQKAIAQAQMEVAVKNEVNISFHSVAAPGMSALCDGNQNSSSRPNDGYSKSCQGQMRLAIQ